MSHFKEEYLNFDEYIRQGESSQREKAGPLFTYSPNRRMECTT